MFYSDNFTFDGISNDMMDVVLVTTKNKDILSNQGTTYIDTLKQSDTINDDPYYINDKRDVEDLDLEFCYINKDYSAAKWDEDKIKEIMDWLVQDDFKPFISEDNDEVTYYLRATKVSKLFNSSMKGMIQITFQPYTAYGYKQRMKKIDVTDETILKIENESSVIDNIYYPIFEITGVEDNSSVEILNTKNDTRVLKIEGLKKDETIIIDNFYYTVQNQDGLNCFDRINRKWISLKEGKNQLKIKGKCKFIIKCNFPVLV